MKVLVFPLLLALALVISYVFRASKKVVWIVTLVTIFLVALGVMEMSRAEKAPDVLCGRRHFPTSQAPKTLTTALDYFFQGDYDVESGKCQQAVADYTKSIELNSHIALTYNNRGYTYMRLRNYGAALADLNKAIELRPNYVNALMNRGDLYNYYGPVINRELAIKDYERVIALGGNKDTSVCGHLFLAKHNGWNLGTFLDLPQKFLNPCQ